MQRSYYSVIQYVPDPFAGERVNVGLVVLSADGDFGAIEFRDSRRRAQRLSPGANLDFIDAVRDELSARLPSRGRQRKLGLVRPLTLQDLRRRYEESGNVLQFSEPRPSSAEPEQLVQRLSDMYLPRLERAQRSRGSRAVRGVIRRAILATDARDHLRAEVAVRGLHDEYSFPFGLVNGTVRHVIEALSLERSNKDEVRADLYATAYRFEDLRRADFLPPMSLVVAAAPSDELLGTARSVVADVGGRLVTESEVPDWAAESAALVVAGT